MYNLQTAWRVVSDLDIPALQRTFQWLVDRHETFRTTFHFDGHEPVQAVHPKEAVFFRIRDASEWSEEEFRTDVDRECGRPFDLEKGPLMRVHLYLREPGRHLLLTTFHHIAVDLWSATLLYEDVRRFYPKVRAGEKPPPPPALTYADYIRWQTEKLAGPEGENLWRFWQTQFEGEIQQLVLSGDFPRAPSANFAGAAFPFKLDRDLTGRLRDLAAKTRSTLNTVLLAASESLLHLTAGRDLFLIRSLALGRSRAEWESIVGNFANPIILRVDFGGEPDFIETIARAQRTVVAAIEHQDYPFERLMEKIRFGRKMAFNPMSEVMFILQTPQRFLPERKGQTCALQDGMYAPGDTGVRFDFGGLILEKFNPRTATTLNDLDIQTIDIGGELSAVINYRTDLFRPATVARMADDFKHFLRLAVENPNQPIRAFAEKLEMGSKFRSPAVALAARPAPVITAEETLRPPDDVEARLIDILMDILGTGEIRPDIRFFDIGGNSLQALQLTVLAREKFGVDLPLRRLFENPTVAGLADMIRTSARGESLPPIPRLGVKEPAPLSFSQERLWFLDRLMGESPFLNIPAAVRLRGPLDARALERSLNEVIKRQEILRTTYGLAGAKPVQTVRDVMPVKLPVEDLRAYPPEEQISKAKARMSALAMMPFDLSTGPLVRMNLFKLGGEDHLALLVIHHIAADAWSLGILLRDLAAFYGLFAEAQAAALPELPIQYADYSIWQRRNAANETSPPHLAYWKDALKNAPALELPTDRPRPAVQKFRGGSRPLEISAELVQSLGRLGAQEETSTFMTLLAAFLAVLHRWSGSSDIVIGTPAAGRDRTELENLLGCFINLLPLRTDLSGDPSFLHLLARVKETCLGAYVHQDLPFEKIVEELRPGRNLGREPVFQAMFAFQNAPLSAFRLPGGTDISPFDLESETTRYDLTLFFVDRDGALQGRFEFDRDLFFTETIERMAGHFLALLTDAVENPGKKISALQMMGEEERVCVTRLWNATRVERSAPLCIHELFAANANKFPDREAIVSEGRVVTYRELNSEAETIALILRGMGAGPEKTIAVCLERGPDLAAAVLGILKAGAAYLPLDPGFPPERVSFMVADAKAVCIIVNAETAYRMTSAGAPVLSLDSLRSRVSWKETAAPPAPVDPENLAYVMYTSGSTGRPKGVMVTHRALANYLLWCVEAYRMTEGKGVLFHSSPAYDFSLTTFLAPLAAGQKIICSPSSPAGPAPEFLAKTGQGLTLMKFTPTHAQALGRIMDKEWFARATQTLVLGGEELRAPQIARWLDLAPATALFNEYGPTEAAVGCCVRRVEPGTKNGEAIPVGRPISNARMYILDRHFRPAPVGVPGEIFIGGACLARGYLGRPDLTAASFFPDPFAEGPGERLYRTGDLGRRLSNGDIEYLGRGDGQVKIRGFRVEPGEVESALSLCPGIRQAAVGIDSEFPGRKSLAAYIVLDESEPHGRTDPATVIREHLRRRLPDYMIPMSFVFLDRLPLLENGKIDRRALRPPSDRRRQTKKPRGAPRTADEKNIARIFETALGIQNIGLDENFFDLGGHSLLAVQAAADLGKSFPEAKIDLLAFFAHPTVESLAGLIGDKKRGSENKTAETSPRPTLVVLKPGGDGAPLFFIHPSGGDVTVYRDLAAELKINSPIFGIQSGAGSAPETEHDSIESMAEGYAAIIRETYDQGSYRIAGWSMGAAVAMAVAAILEKQGAAIDYIGLLDPPAMFGLCTGPRPGLSEFLGRLRESDISSSGLSAGIFDKAARLIKIHEELLASFQPSEIRAPVFIWNSSSAPARDIREGQDERSSIRDFTSGAVRRASAGGDHWSMLRHPHVEALAADMNVILSGIGPPVDRTGMSGPGDEQFPPMDYAPAKENRDDEDPIIYTVVANHEEQFSIWPDEIPLPRGWQETGFRRRKDKCLERVASLWTDMRPLSLRKKMDGEVK